MSQIFDAIQNTILHTATTLILDKYTYPTGKFGALG